MRRVVFSKSALRDLEALQLYISRDSPGAGRKFALAIREYCGGLSDFPERGQRRPQIHPTLRTVAFARRATLAFLVGDRQVTIVAILYVGRNVEAALDERLGGDHKSLPP